ncbi:VOC family protein [Brevibacterium album]|uniref:VOC family protein n=1 Tax=Brevibacterium album TaxID=417948 RepID=UPI0004178EFA|nr:VOC family protein [Brevibacterium album]
MTTAVEHLISLPIADRRRSMDFYREAFGFEAVGVPEADGVPEPLQFRLGARTLLVLVPSGGFGWVLGDRPLAPYGASECLLGLVLTAEAEVDEVIERVRRAGGEVSAEPANQDWGYTAICTDPDGHAWQVTAGSSTAS